MKKPMTTLILTLGLMLLLDSCKLATIRPLDPETGKAIINEEEQGFNATRYVKERWNDPLLTTVESSATDLKTLLTELAADKDKASTAYGKREGSSPYNFLVKGQARLLAIDTSSRAGLAQLDLEPFDGVPDAALAVGPVIKGTGLRDALPFISFNDFVNQLEFADVSKALHQRVMDEVLAKTDLTNAVGKTINFAGAFTLSDINKIVITPVRLEVQ
jgi:predicted lipoprotein